MKKRDDRFLASPPRWISLSMASEDPLFVQLRFLVVIVAAEIIPTCYFVLLPQYIISYSIYY